MMREDQECQSLSLGMPRCTPKKYSRRLKRVSLGMPPLYPLLHQQLSGLSPSAIFLLLHMLCAELGASVLGYFALFDFNKSDPCMLAVGEIHAPLFSRILYVEYLPSVSSYCLLVCSCFYYLSFARAY